jgi:nicotinamidase-related amidase
MPVTALDPETALIIVDLQKGIASLPLVHPIAEILRNARALVDAFREQKLTIVLVNVAGAAPGRTEQPRRNLQFTQDFTDLLPELNQQQGDILITKRTWGAFASTDLESRLRARGVTQVVLAGVATGTGVESTARQAYELGFHVTLAVDAMTDGRPEAHDYSLAHVFPRLGETGTTEEILEMLTQRSTAL